MMLLGVCQRWMARPGGGLAVVVLTIAVGGCAASQPAGISARQPSQPGVQPAATARPGRYGPPLARRYLAIAVPANHRLEIEVDGYARDARRDLAAAESQLRAEAATERWFDQRLSAIAFPPAIAVTARALIQANQRRAELTDRQARSGSLTGLWSFTSLHKAADAAVEVQVVIIRRALGLPPPAGS
jgi:hypothetical protein